MRFIRTFYQASQSIFPANSVVRTKNNPNSVELWSFESTQK